MVFSIIIIALVAVVAYFHYVQGLFTAAISVGCALIALLVAFGYYENLVSMIGQSKNSDMAAPAMLMLLFGVTYVFLRVIFDAVVPGNVSYPLYVERVGSALLGLLAGIMSVGTFAVAAQLMPFGASIAMSSKFDVPDRDRVIIPDTVFGPNQRSKDSGVQHELIGNSLDPTQASNLLLPADNIALSLVKLASAGGYGDAQSFAAIHPDLTLEAFGDRLGADPATGRAIVNTPKRKNADVTAVYMPTVTPTGYDSEIPAIRPDGKSLAMPKDSKTIFIVRVLFDVSIADKDNYVRITPAAVRLVVDGVNYNPIGTMATKDLIGLNRLDDQLPVVMQGKGRSADFVFALPKSVASSIVEKSKVKADSAFIEVKLFGRVDLSGKPIEAYPGPGDTAVILRKPSSPLGQAMQGVTPK